MNYLIYGLGISGISAAKYLSKAHQVTLTDDNPQITQSPLKDFNKEITFKKFSDIDFSQINKVIIAPGIPLYFPQKHPILEKQKQYNFELICDIEDFYRINQNNTFIGITGTNGKSTSTALCNHIFTDLNLNSQMGGNIGTPAFDLTNETNNNYIFELSSYQLDLVDKVHLDIACLLNITPDHIDRHGSFENYKKTKAAIFNNQSINDYAIINIDDQNTQSIFSALQDGAAQKIITLSIFSKQENGLSYIGDKISINTDFLKTDLELDHKYLKGDHNKQNILASLAMTLCHLNKENLEINLDKIIDSISNFKGLKHRQEFVRSIENINFINDSKATNCDSTKTALHSYENIFLILGGKEKDGISDIIDELKKVKRIYLIGESSENFAEILLKNSIDFVKDKELNVAIKNAYFDAKKLNNSGTVNIILSPACSSFDQFQNFEKRGEYFCKIVNELQKS